MQVKATEEHYMPIMKNEVKAAGWFAILNFGMKELNFLWWCYMDEYLKENPHQTVDEVQEIVKHELLYDFSRMYKNNLYKISVFAKRLYENKALEVLKENPLFTKTDLNIISQCLQKEV